MSLYDKKEWVGCSYYYSEKWIKEAIKELKMRFNEWNEKMFRLETIELLIDEIFGKELCSGVEE